MITLALALGLGLGGCVKAQTGGGLRSERPAAKPLPPDDPMKALDFLIGEWKGSGWMILGPNKKENFRQSEIVTPRMDGRILIIDGLGHSAREPSQIIHEAFALLSYDYRQRKYLMRNFRKGAPDRMDTLSPEVSVNNGTLSWQFEIPQAGTMRYTIWENEKKQWQEVGERSADGGKTWTKFFSMVLDRVK